MNRFKANFKIRTFRKASQYTKWHKNCIPNVRGLTYILKLF